MTISFTNNEHPLVFFRAQQVESFLDSVGIRQEEYFLGSNIPQNNPYRVAGQIVGHENEFVVRTETSVTYVRDHTRSWIPICIPYFLPDMGINLTQMLEKNVSISAVISAITQFPTVSAEIEVPGSPPIPEGYTIRPWQGLYQLLHKEKGNEGLICETPYPWVVGLEIAWRSNYRRIDWPSFNKRPPPASV